MLFIFKVKHVPFLKIQQEVPSLTSKYKYTTKKYVLGNVQRQEERKYKRKRREQFGDYGGGIGLRAKLKHFPAIVEEGPLLSPRIYLRYDCNLLIFLGTSLPHLELSLSSRLFPSPHLHTPPGSTAPIA